MKDAQKPDHISLNNLIRRLKEGQFVIPDFQRDFEWKPWDVRDLMRSIFLDYFAFSEPLFRSFCHENTLKQIHFIELHEL